MAQMILDLESSINHYNLVSPKTPLQFGFTKENTLKYLEVVHFISNDGTHNTTFRISTPKDEGGVVVYARSTIAEAVSTYNSL